jgi:transposase-like protein
MRICNRCGGSESHKNGMMNGKQRYRCKSCGFNFTTGFRGKPIEVRQQALKLYQEGLGFRAIGRILEVSNVTVLNWVRANGQGSKPKTSPAAADETKASEAEEGHPPVENEAASAAQVSTQDSSS